MYILTGPARLREKEPSVMTWAHAEMNLKLHLHLPNTLRVTINLTKFLHYTAVRWWICGTFFSAFILALVFSGLNFFFLFFLRTKIELFEISVQCSLYTHGWLSYFWATILLEAWMTDVLSVCGMLMIRCQRLWWALQNNSYVRIHPPDTVIN